MASRRSRARILVADVMEQWLGALPGKRSWKGGAATFPRMPFREAVRLAARRFAIIPLSTWRPEYVLQRAQAYHSG